MYRLTQRQPIVNPSSWTNPSTGGPARGGQTAGNRDGGGGRGGGGGGSRPGSGGEGGFMSMNDLRGGQSEFHSGLLRSLSCSFAADQVALDGCRATCG